MIKAVIFDLDDTLYKELDYVRQGFWNVAQSLNVDDTERVYQRMNQLLDTQGRGKIFDVICQEWRLNLPIKQLVDAYRDTQPMLSMYEDAEELVGMLRQRGLKIGVITDGCSKVQHNKMNALSLEKCMDVLVATDDLGKDTNGEMLCKPNPKVYEYALDKLACKPQEAIYIGDNPKKDFIGAKQLGMQTIRIIREIGDHMQDVADDLHEADWTVQDLREVKQLLFGLQQNGV